MKHLRMYMSYNTAGSMVDIESAWMGRQMVFSHGIFKGTPGYM